MASLDAGAQPAGQDGTRLPEPELRKIRSLPDDEINAGERRNESVSGSPLLKPKTSKLESSSLQEKAMPPEKESWGDEQKKPQAPQPNCLQCSRNALCALYFCGICLNKEASKWRTEVKRAVRVKKPRFGYYNHLSKAEVLELEPLPPETRSFCMRARVTVKMMQSMLARHGLQPHKPLRQQSEPRVEDSDTSNKRKGSWEGQGSLNPKDDEFPGRAQRNRFGAGGAAEKRKNRWENNWRSSRSDDEKTMSPTVKSAKKVKFETAVVGMDLEKHPSDVVHANAEASHGPNDDDSIHQTLEQILQTEMAARPNSPLMVGLAVKKELEKQLIADIMHGDPNQGRPIQTSLLRALDAILGEWEAVDKA